MSDMPGDMTEPAGETPASEGSFDLKHFLDLLGVKNSDAVASALEAWKGGDNGPAHELSEQLSKPEAPAKSEQPDDREPMMKAIRKGMKENPNPFAKGNGGY